METLPILQEPPADGAGPDDITNTRESPPSPITTIQPEKCDEKTTETTREEPPPSTQQQAPRQDQGPAIIQRLRMEDPHWLTKDGGSSLVN